MKVIQEVLFLEALESRIAPATLTYTDVDGDRVTISSSKGDLAGRATFADAGEGQQLQKLDLTDDIFANANIKVTVKKGTNGDGFANVGFIDATGNDLSNVRVAGDLGRIVAGDANVNTPAIKSLRVASMGVLGTTTQGGIVDAVLPPEVTDTIEDLAGGLLDDLGDVISGVLDSNTLENLSGTLARTLSSLGANLETLNDLIKGAAGGLLPNVGSLIREISSDVSELAGLGDGLDDLLGVDLSGLVSDASTALGDLVGSLPSQIDATVDVEDLLGLDLNALLGLDLGGLFGSAGNLVQNLGDRLADLLNGADFDQLPERVQALLTETQNLLQPILDGTGTVTQELIATLSDLSTTLAGLLGIAGRNPGTIPDSIEDQLDDVLDDIRELLGGDTAVADDPDFNLSSDILGDLRSLRVDRNIQDAFINVDGDVRSIRIGGSLIGTTFENGGSIFVTGDVGSLTIGKNLIGGEEVNSGMIMVAGAIRSLTVNGAITGGEGTRSGSISAEDGIRSLAIKGNMKGGAGDLSASIFSDHGGVDRLSVRGSMIAGEGSDSMTVRVENAIRSLTVSGNIVGDGDNRVALSALGLETKVRNVNPAFGNIRITGSVLHSDILGGYDTGLNPGNGDAQIGMVTVRGSWSASNISAGVADLAGDSDRFGEATDSSITQNDTAGIIARIAGITIRGQVFGTQDAGDHYGFVAEEIRKVSIGRGKLALDKGPNNDVIELAEATGDVTVREVAA